MDNAILEIEGIIALLETMPPHNEIDVKSGAVPLASAEGTLRPDPRKVFVVHGRNEPARRAMFAFLRSIRLEPIEWIQAVSQTASGSPHIGEILDHAFSQAQAVVVLLTGDDVARLAARFMRPGDPVHERELTPQARPNVLFEAGMAFGRQPTRTILVTLGPVRPFSDIAGRHLIVMDDSVAKRQALATRLADVGCAASITHGTDWHTEGQFEAAIRPSSEYEEALALDAGPHRTSSALLALSRGSKSLWVKVT